MKDEGRTRSENWRPHVVIVAVGGHGSKVDEMGAIAVKWTIMQGAARYYGADDRRQRK